MENLLEAIKLVKKAHDDTGKSSGTIKCPKCGYDLHWIYSTYNGHSHGNCTNKDCEIGWMM